MSTPFEINENHLQPLLELITQLDLNDPKNARDQLNTHYPLTHELIGNIKTAMLAGVENQTMCHKGEAPVQFSRAFKANPENFNISADAVLMSAPGPKHKHPQGEIDLCFTLDGEPTFDGQPEGWVVYGPNSKHIPTVKNGTMLILYLLPTGAIEFVTE